MTAAPAPPKAETLAAEWNTAMLAGDFERAWQASDHIRALPTPDPHRFWQGEPLTGKRVILRCLHGFGDSIQFLRYVPQLRRITSSLILEVAPRFVDLARHLAGVAEVITWGPDAPTVPPQWDVQIEVTELPYIFRTQLADLPIATSYLHIPAQPIPGSFNIGLVCTAGEWNPSRSIPFSTLQPLLDLPGCTFWNLQPTPAPGLQEDPQARQTLVGLAHRIAQLDLVITVDTLAAHLAGAIGIPTWLLLQHAADWRWMQHRTDTPWYPTLRLFRQPTPGDWPAVIHHVTQSLATLPK